jgi:hypothetical protein
MVYGTSGQKASTSTNGGQYESLCSGSGHFGAFGGCRISPRVYPSYGYALYGYGYKATAPLYDYAGLASSAPVPTAPHKYGSLIYAPQLYAPTPAFPVPPAEPGYYTAQSVVVPQPFYHYAPGHWGRYYGIGDVPGIGGAEST